MKNSSKVQVLELGKLGNVIEQFDFVRAVYSERFYIAKPPYFGGALFSLIEQDVFTYSLKVSPVCSLALSICSISLSSNLIFFLDEPLRLSDLFLFSGCNGCAPLLY